MSKNPVRGRITPLQVVLTHTLMGMQCHYLCSQPLSCSSLLSSPSHSSSSLTHYSHFPILSSHSPLLFFVLLFYIVQLSAFLSLSPPCFLFIHVKQHMNKPWHYCSKLVCAVQDVCTWSSVHTLSSLSNEIKARSV